MKNDGNNNLNVLSIRFEIVNVIIEQYAYSSMLYSMFHLWKVLLE